MLIIFVGPAGAGKGTQSKRLQTYLGIPPLSTGEILREAVSLGTEYGKAASESMGDGKLVPDEIVVGMVTQQLAEPAYSQGCLLDGFPRNLAQAEALDAVLAKQGRHVDLLLELVVNEEELIRRLDERKRPDDRPDAIKRRLKIYHDQTRLVTKHYSERGLLRQIDGIGTQDEVFERIREAVDAVEES